MHDLKPDGRGQGMRVCVVCGKTEPEDSTPCRENGDVFGADLREHDPAESLRQRIERQA